jgi:hypothetical protein
MVTAPVDLKAALAAADFDRLLGTPEDTWIDFKKEPYRLDTFKGRWEYAKDVAALANMSGGCLVIGVKTGRSQNELVSVAESYAPIPKKLVDLKQHGDALINGVYPEVWGVTFSWFPPNDGSDAGLLLVEVPAQRQRDKPFVMRTMLGPEDRQMNALGIPVRNGSETIWLKAERIHPLLGAALGTAAAESDAELRTKRLKRADEIIEMITRENEWTDTPILFLQAFPPAGPPVLPDLHSSDGIGGSLVSPRARRHGAFDLEPAGEVTPRDGGLFQIDSRKALWLDRDGLLTVGGIAGPDFLGWAMNKREQDTGPFALNATAFVEYVYEFFRFVYEVLAPRAGSGRWSFRVVSRGWKSLQGGLTLTEGRPEVAWMQTAHAASGDALDDEVEGTGSAGKDAFAVLGRLYGLFGLSTGAIPFTADGAVSVDLLPK